MKNNKKNNSDKKAHKLNNILTNVILSADLLISELYGKLNITQKKHLKNIISEAKKIKKLVKD